MLKTLSIARVSENLQAPTAVVHQLIPVDVVLDPSALTLTVEGTAPLLTEGDDLVWRFFHLKDGMKSPGLPKGWTPNIFVFDGPEDPRPGLPPLYTGPFSSLRVAPTGVLGRGSRGLNGTYFYRALAVNAAEGGGGIIESSDQSLTTTDSAHLVVPQVSVSVNLLEKKFEVFPLNVFVYPDEPLSWIFLDLPDGFRPIVRFSRENSSTEDFFFGPFECLSVSEKKVTGTGRNGATGRFGYSILVVDANGNQLELLNSPDPHIDTEPDPFTSP